MKKTILLVIFMLSMRVAVIAQEKVDPSPTKTESTMQVVDKVFDRTTAAVKGIADALKVPAEKVFTILVKQQVVNAIVWLIIDVMCLTIFGIFARKIWKHANKYSDDSGGMSYFTALVMTIVPFIITFYSLKIIVIGFVNPEYGAIKEILSIL